VALQTSTQNSYCSHQQLVLQKLFKILNYELLTSQIYLELGKDTQYSENSDLHSLSIRALEEDETHCRLISRSINRYVEELNVDNPSPNEQQFHLDQYSISDKIKLLQRTETLLVKAYHNLCALTIENDYRMFDLAFCNGIENANHVESLNSFFVRNGK